MRSKNVGTDKVGMYTIWWSTEYKPFQYSNPTVYLVFAVYLGCIKKRKKLVVYMNQTKGVSESVMRKKNYIRNTIHTHLV